MGAEGMMWLAIGMSSVGGAVVLVAFLGGPIGKAIARRISGGVDTGRLEELEHRLEDLTGRLDSGFHEQLAEMHERLEFTERLLARAQLSPSERAPLDEPSGVATPV